MSYFDYFNLNRRPAFPDLLRWPLWIYIDYSAIFEDRSAFGSGAWGLFEIKKYIPKDPTAFDLVGEFRWGNYSWRADKLTGLLVLQSDIVSGSPITLKVETRRETINITGLVSPYASTIDYQYEVSKPPLITGQLSMEWKLPKDQITLGATWGPVPFYTSYGIARSQLESGRSLSDRQKRNQHDTKVEVRRGPRAKVPVKKRK